MKPLIAFIHNYYLRKFPSETVLQDDEQIQFLHRSQELILVRYECIAENDEYISWIGRAAGYQFKSYIYSKADQQVWEELLPGRPDHDNEYRFLVYKWIGDYLFIVYVGDWNHHHICSLNNRILRYTRVEGESLRIFRDFLTYRNYGPDQTIQKLTIPQLEFVRSLTREEADKMGITPNSELRWDDAYNFHAFTD